MNPSRSILQTLGNSTACTNTLSHRYYRDFVLSSLDTHSHWHTPSPATCSTSIKPQLPGLTGPGPVLAGSASFNSFHNFHFYLVIEMKNLYNFTDLPPPLGSSEHFLVPHNHQINVRIWYECVCVRPGWLPGIALELILKPE